MKPSLPIERISPPSRADFRKLFIRRSRPVVITGLMKDWPASKLWTPSYFARAYGEVKITTQKSTGGKITVDEYSSTTINQCVVPINKGDFEVRSFITTPVSDFPAQLRKQYTVPAYCADGKLLRSRIFIAPASAITPLHQDLPENLFALVNGERRITLFAPLEPVYPYPRFSRSPNFARAEIENPDYEKFPKLAQAQPYTVDLVSGETLFIPSFWWHHFHTLEPSISINFWWNYGWKVPLGWMAALYGRLRSLGNYNARK
jgi:Cupin-like domain